MVRNRFRWLVVVLLFAVTVINYVDRAAIAYAVPDIEAEFGLSSGQIGLILGAFAIGYVITPLFAGVAVDRIGPRLTLAVAAVFWTAAIGLTAAATSFAMLYAARIMLGLAEGPNFPAMSGAVSRWLPPEERARALAGALVAVPLALAAGAPLVATLVGSVGWRGAFACLAVLGLLWLPVWLLFFRDGPEQSRHVTAAERAHIERGCATDGALADGGRGGWRILLTTPTLLANCWAYFVFGYFLFFFMSWLPDYLRRVYGLELAQIGLLSVLPWLAGAAALVAFGQLSDRVLAATGSLRKARSLQIAGSQAVAAVAVVPVTLSGDLSVAIAGITVAVAATMAANAAYYVTVADLVPRHAGSGLGIMTVAFAFAGFLAPVVTGFVLQLTGTFAPAFLLMAALAASSVIGVIAFHRPDRDAARLAA